MSVLDEIPAFEFKFDTHSLPLSRSNLSLGFAVWKPDLYRFNHVAKFMGDHSEKEHNAVLVYRSVSQTTKIYRVSVRRSIVKSRVAQRRSRLPCVRRESAIG
jgi:hypothetical protein